MKILSMYFKDEIVISATRTPKPLSQVAENMSVITSEDIEMMNAHTLTELLDRASGVFVTFFGRDFGSDASLQIQGSEDRHVLVLVDGIPWNFLSGGNAGTNSIPVRIIKRIEIIKGPASSSWGSSLGGVVNVITKDTGESVTPSGSVSVSYGERDTQDYSAEAAGKAGYVRYYLYVGKQDSDGLRFGRDFENDTAYSKLEVPLSDDIKFMLTSGYGEHSINTGDLPSSDLSNNRNIGRFFYTKASVSAILTGNLRADASYYLFRQKLVQKTNKLSTGELFQDSIYDDETRGGSSKLLWKDKTHNAVLGFDFSDGNLDQTIRAGPFLQALGAPETSMADPGIEKWAIFANDTITMGKLSVTPGIRFDHNNVSGDFTSPSLGVTLRISDSSILRASLAKGFTVPPLSFTSGGGLFLDPNPDLKPEKVWSYQAGVESRIADFLRAGIIFFSHDMKNALVKELFAAGPPTFNDLYFNKGEIKRDGVEFHIETVPYYYVSLETGGSYFHKRSYLEDEEGDVSEDVYVYNVTVIYDNKKYVLARLDGQYIWWDRDDSATREYGTFIWDLNLIRNMYSSDNYDAELFFTMHNITNASLYTLGDRKNPRRWLEAGVRLRF
jgi:vitamin B12 transporter